MRSLAVNTSESDKQRWFDLNYEFHDILLRAAGRRHHLRVLEIVRALAEPYIRMELGLTGSFDKAQEERDGLISAFAARRLQNSREAHARARAAYRSTYRRHAKKEQNRKKRIRRRIAFYSRADPWRYLVLWSKFVFIRHGNAIRPGALVDGQVADLLGIAPSLIGIIASNHPISWHE